MFWGVFGIMRCVSVCLKFSDVASIQLGDAFPRSNTETCMGFGVVSLVFWGVYIVFWGYIQYVGMC